jgi:hypothetical protein
MIEKRRPVLGPTLKPSAGSVQEAAAAIRERLEQLDALLERQNAAFLAGEEWSDDGSVRQLIVETAAMCMDVVGLDPAAAGAPDAAIIATNVETFAPPRLAIHLSSELWQLLTRYYLNQFSGDHRTEQLRQVAMYALLAMLVDQVLVMNLL